MVRAEYTHSQLRTRVALTLCAGFITLALLLAGCGGAAATTGPTAGNNATVQAIETATADAGGAATGDIPDNATYLKYSGPIYSIQYVEGWTKEQLTNNGVRFADKDSFVTVTIQSLPSGSMTDYAHGQGTTTTSGEFQQFANGHVKSVTLPANEAGLLTFEALSTPNAVTGKTTTLAFNRYYIRGAHAMAVLTQATPLGVDNVDGFLQIAKSFAWV